MIKIENIDTFGWISAVRGMRNPLNSWDKSDSKISYDKDGEPKNLLYIGKDDLTLMMKLRNAGPDHRKFMRMINVYMDITAPLYWWKEMDTYSVGKVQNSCSTMHTIHRKEFTLDDFSHEHLLDATSFGEPSEENLKEMVKIEEPTLFAPDEAYFTPKYILKKYIIGTLNFYRERYIETGDKKYWWQMIQLLPTSYNQKRTVMLNYEVLLNIYKNRRYHKLDEWVEFCNIIEEKLPVPSLITWELEDEEDEE